jgi:hypothetical protein
MPVIPVLRKQKQKASLGYVVRSCLKNIFLKKRALCQAPVAHTCNPSLSGGRDQEDHSWKLAPGKYFMRPYLENTQHKKEKKKHALHMVNTLQMLAIVITVLLERMTPTPHKRNLSS